MRPLRVYRPALAALALTAALAGCDAADSGGATDADAVTTEDAAVLVGAALALDAGGALDAVAAAAEPDAANRTGSSDPGCTVERTYDAATQAWTRVVACERGDAGGAFYARYGRTKTIQFLDAAGAPQQTPGTAASLDVTLVNGYGERRTPVYSHALLDLAGDFTVDGLQTDTVTVNGTYRRAATDTLRTRRAERALTYEMDLAFDDVRGPRGVRQHWGRAVSGTITGTVSGTTTVENRGGTRQRDFERQFTVTFGAAGGARVAEIRVGGETFRADLTTGVVAGAN